MTRMRPGITRLMVCIEHPLVRERLFMAQLNINRTHQFQTVDS